MFEIFLLTAVILSALIFIWGLAKESQAKLLATNDIFVSNGVDLAKNYSSY